MSVNTSKTTRSRFSTWWYEDCGRIQRPSDSISLSSLFSSITYDWHVSDATTALSFSSDRRTPRRTETDIRTNRWTSRDTDRRALGKKQKQEAQDNRRESRDRTGDKDGGAVCCTLRRVLLRWWRGSVMIVLCCCVLAVLLSPLRLRFVLCSLEVTTIPLFRWSRLQDVQDTTRSVTLQGCRRRQKKNPGG